MDHHLGDNEEGNDRSSGEGGSNNTQQKIWSLRDSSDEFAMFSFKIVPCSRVRAHDWTVCPYAHPGEKAKRRDLKMFSYTAIPCADYQKVPASNTKAKGSHEYFCPRGASCPYAHGVFESWLHPSRYRTQLCKDGLRCTRKACFFAHRAKELRNVRTAANAVVSPDGNIENTKNNDGDNINNNNYSNSNDNNSNKSTVDNVAKTMIATTMQQQQQQLTQSRSESWAAVHANPQNQAASSQLGSIEYGKPDPLTRLSIESVNDERRRYQQNYDQFVSQQQISQMTVNQELSALYLSQRQRELEQQQLLLLQQQDQQRQQQQQQQQQMTLAKNAAIMQQIQQLQQQELQLQQMQQMRQMQQMQTQQEQTSPRDGKKKSSYDDLGMIEDVP
jgi:hypothetical protein